jgi:6-phospho-beta-glucosidase
MARIKLAYIGGGSTRAPGTLASFVAQGENFDGSEVVLIDLDPDRLALVKTLADKMARRKSLDLTISATTDRKRGLADCDAVLTSYRPGGFEARALDERIPLKHGVIGQETQGPGGFFMALRAIHVMKDIMRDMQAVCPRAWLFNYTNPINIVAQAVTQHTDIRTVSLCEGPLHDPRMLAATAGLDPGRVDAVMVGLNHASWSVRHLYDGEDMIPLLCTAYEHKRKETPTDAVEREQLRLLALAATIGSIPASYFQYYYFTEEIVAELHAKPTMRAEDIMALAPDYWRHYQDQAAADAPQLDPRRSRGGIHELELALDVMDAIFNDRNEVWPVNTTNRGALPDFPDDLVVEVPGYVDRYGVTPLPQERLPRHVVGLVKMLGEYQALAAEAAWHGTRRDAVRALASNPLCLSLGKAEAIYDEMAAAHRAYLPERLLR